MSVLTFRAFSPDHATPRRSRSWFTTATTARCSSATISPSRMETFRRAVLATVGSCVTMTTARSGDSSPAKISSTWAALAESSAPVGSSARIMSGSVTMARAKATRCCSPPDICTGRWSTRAPSPRRSRAAQARSRRTLAADVSIQERCLDVAERREVRDEMELLEDEPDRLAAQPRAGGVVERADVLARRRGSCPTSAGRGRRGGPAWWTCPSPTARRWRGTRRAGSARTPRAGRRPRPLRRRPGRRSARAAGQAAAVPRGGVTERVHLGGHPGGDAGRPAADGGSRAS